MRIILFLNRDMEANLAFNILKKSLLGHTIRIYYSDTVGNPTKKPKDLIQLEYFEKDFFFNELPKFLHTYGIETDFEFFNENFISAPFQLCENVNSPDFISEIRVFEPDLFISIRFGKIFKTEIIGIPNKGLLNLHSGILPDYKGIMSTLQAIREGKEEIGCTLHTIPNGGINNGEIIEIAKMDIRPSRSLFWHIINLYPLGSDLIERALKIIQDKEILNLEIQNYESGNYFSLPTDQDIEQIKSKGFKMISDKDYLDILTSLVLPKLTDSEKQNLSIFLEKNIQ
jgi:methionyl-tRNA formyltransferase